MILDATRHSHNMLEIFGAVTAQEIATNKRAYLGTRTRQAQDSASLYKCLMASLAPTGKNKVALVTEQYKLQGFILGPPPPQDNNR